MDHLEPTIFFIIRQPSTSDQLKSQLYTTLKIMLEHSSISKQFTDLEKVSKDGEDSVKKSFFQMHDILGQFLRFIHYILICSLHEGVQNAH